MGIFGNKSKRYTPCNRLEEELLRLKGHPERVPEFLRMIFHFELLALGELNEEGDRTFIGFHTLQGARHPVILAFTSKDALSYYLTERKEKSSNFVGMPAHELFQIAQDGFELVINAAHEHPLYFKSEDIETLLSGPQFASETLEEQEAVEIGKPTSLPDNLLKVLSDYKNAQKKLQMIYFGLVVRNGQDPELLAILDFGEHLPSDTERQRLQSDIYQLTSSSYKKAMPMQFLVEQDRTRIQEFIKNDALYII